MVVTEGGITGNGFGKFLRPVCDNNINQSWCICDTACWFMDNVFYSQNVHEICQDSIQNLYQASLG